MASDWGGGQKPEEEGDSDAEARLRNAGAADRAWEIAQREKAEQQKAAEEGQN